MATNFIHWVDNETQKLSSSITLNTTDMITKINDWLVLFMFIGVIFLGYMVLMGYGKESLRRFIAFFFKFIIISSILTSYTYYDSLVGNSVREIPTALVNLVNCKASDPACTDPTKYSRTNLLGASNLLDEQYSAFFIISKSAWSKASTLDNHPGMWVLSFALIIFSTIFTVAAGFILIIVFLLSKLLVIFGPIFIASMVFSATQRFFGKWLELIIKLILIEVFAVISSIFIYDQMEALITGLGFSDYATINAAPTAINAIYEHITLAKVSMICCIFLLGILILRLIVPVADELSKGLKLFGDIIIKTADNFISGNTQPSQNFNTANHHNNQSSFSSLFTQNASNDYKQIYNQSLSQNLASQQDHRSGHLQSNHATNTANNSYSNKIKTSRINPTTKYKMAYQNRFRGEI